MVELVYVGGGYTLRLKDSCFSVSGRNYEDAKERLLEMIGQEIDRYVNNRLSSIVSDDIIRIEFEDDGK